MIEAGTPVCPAVDCLFDDRTNSATYVVSDLSSRVAAVIDPVLDFDPVAGRTWTESAERVLRHVEQNRLTVEWIYETHIHADHLSASRFLKERLGAGVAIGAGVVEVQETFGAIYDILDEVPADGSQFDRLVADGETLAVGGIEGRAMATPGHTPACMTYVIGDACFIGDTMFMPDSGTARCDFPGGSAKTLFSSIQRILALPDDTRVYVCHDYGAGGTRDFAWETTIARERDDNTHVGGGALEHDFVHMREARDATLSLPRLLIPAIQVNIRAGRLPEPESNGTSYLKVPLNVL